MTASIPDGISFEELQSMMKDASDRESEDECPCCASRDQIYAAAESALQSALDMVNDPMVHKIMMMEILSNMVAWHTKMGRSLIEEDCTEAGIAWLRDAGKFQSMMCTLTTIDIGDNDWLTQE